MLTRPAAVRKNMTGACKPNNSPCQNVILFRGTFIKIRFRWCHKCDIFLIRPRLFLVYNHTSNYRSLIHIPYQSFLDFEAGTWMHCMCQGMCTECKSVRLCLEQNKSFCFYCLCLALNCGKCMIKYHQTNSGPIYQPSKTFSNNSGVHLKK